MCSQRSPLKTSSTAKGWARKGLGCLVVVIGIPLIYYGVYFLFRGSLPSNPQLIAHRGGPVYNPENSLAAFRYATEGGIDWIEFDVQRTQDGVLIVIHDETVDRTTNGSGEVKNLTFDQIRALDAGDGERVPTFEEVIALARETGVGLLPEAKSPHLYPGIEAEIASSLEEGQYVEQTVVQSFKPEALETIKEVNPEIQVCPLYGLWELDLSSPLPEEVDVLCPMAEMVILNPWMIWRAHADSNEVYVWFGVIEHPISMWFLLTLGADGLMVDDPRALAEILRR